MKKVAKWTGIILAALVLFFVAAAVIIPFVVDVDKYRPRLVELANERLSGKLELGKLSLSLWGQVRIDIAGLKVLDSKGKNVVAVENAFFHIPFSSVFAGAPIITLKMKAPELTLVSDQSGKLNAMELMKKEEKMDRAAPKAAQTPSSAPKSGESAEFAIPAILAQARMGVELLNAKLEYRDQAKDLSTRVSDLNVVLQDISLSRSTQLKVWANLDTKLGQSVHVRGPLRLSGAANPQLKEGRLVKLASALQLVADDLEVRVPDLFFKPKGIPANVDLAMAASETEVNFERLNVKFHNAEIKSSGVISGVLTEDGVPSARFELASNIIELKDWQSLLPMMKEYEPSGSIQLTARASGPVSTLSYEGDIQASALSIRAPGLKARPVFDAKIRIITDRIESLLVSMKAPGNQLEIRGKVFSFARPQAELVLNSPGMDLDQLLDLPPLGAVPSAGTPAGAPGGGAPPAGSPASATQSDYDALLLPLTKMPLARAFGARAQVNIKAMKVYDVPMSDLSGSLVIRDLNATLERFSMNLWKGVVTASGGADLTKKAPTYRFGVKVSQLDLKEAIASQLSLFKNTVVGRADFDMSGEGASFNPDPAMLNLRAKGKMSVKDATFASIDVGKMAVEALNKSLDRVSEKVPQLKGKMIQPLPNRESRYDLISSDVVIGDGKFVAPNFVAKAAPGKGIDLQGKTTVGMLDKSLLADWTLIDTHNVTRAADLSVDIAGTKVQRVLAEPGKPLRLPVRVGCTIEAPCYSYTQVPEHLGKVALGNLKGRAEGRVKEELQKKAAPLLEKAPPAVKKGLDDLRKKLLR